MKVNLDKLTELETKYKDSYLATDAIQRMMGLVFDRQPWDGTGTLISTVSDPSYIMVFSTLQELGVLEN